MVKDTKDAEDALHAFAAQFVEWTRAEVRIAVRAEMDARFGERPAREDVESPIDPVALIVKAVRGRGMKQ